MENSETGSLFSLQKLEPVPTGHLEIKPIDAGNHSVCFSVVIPTYNEAMNIEAVVARLSDLLSPTLGESYELIVVDDDSPDKTYEVAQRLMKKYRCLRVMRRTVGRGLATAVIRGWQVAKGEYLAVIDADLQHPTEVMLDLLAAMKRGADLAVASRYVEGGGVSDWAIHRRIISRGAQLLGLLVLPSVVGRVKDPMSGYFAVKRTALLGVVMRPKGYKILIEVLARGDIKWISEVGYLFHERLEGESKVTWKIYVEYLVHLIELRFSKFPFNRFLRFITVGMSGVFVDMGFLYLLSDPTTLGWGLTRSKIIAAELAIFNNFIWNDLWTFKDLSNHQAGFVEKVRRFIKFNLICGIGLIFSVTILNVLFNVFSMNRYLADLIAIGAVTIWNYWMNTTLNWRSSFKPSVK